CQPYVLAQQDDESLRVSTFVRCDVPLQECALRQVWFAGRRPLHSAARPPGAQRRSGPKQGTVHRSYGCVEQGSRLDRRPREYVAKDENSPLPGWQQLYCGEECQRDRLAVDGQGVRTKALVEQIVRVRLQRRGRSPQRVQADICCDAIEPGSGTR